MFGRLLNRDIPLSGIGANETTQISIYDYAKFFQPGAQVTFGGFAYQAYKIGGVGAAAAQRMIDNPVVFAASSVRMLLFSEARFQWQQLRNGRPGDLFGNPDLALLEEPWSGHTTGDLLAQAELDVAAAGNSYWVKNGDFLQRLDPANVRLLTAKATDKKLTGYDIGDELIGYAYVPDPQHVTTFPPEEVCHYKPYPNPTNRFLGMSWLGPCLNDVNTDDILTEHKQSVVRNGAVLTTIVTLDPSVSPEQFESFVGQFNRSHDGPGNAAKTLFVTGGTDVKTVGQTFENLMLQATQNSGEIRVAACAGVPPVLIGFSEALKGSSLNAGNYGEARRRMADGTLRPLWRSFASSMQSLLPTPGGARLWFDDRDIAFLREDLGDQANILATNGKTILTLIQAGYEPDAAVQVVLSGDFGRLTGQHTGLTSVQLQPPADEPSAAITNTAPKSLQPASVPALPSGATNGSK